MAFYEPWHNAGADYFRVETGRDFSYPLHIHRCYEMICLTEGSMQLEVDGTEFTLLPGQAALIFPHQVHALRTPAHSRHRLLIFAPELIAAFDRDYVQKLPSSPIISCIPVPVQALLDALSPQTDLYDIKGTLYCLCHLAHAQLSFAAKASRTPGNASLLKDILRFIGEHYQEDCSLRALSDATRYEITYLSKFFSSRVGVPFITYVNQVRMAHACYLLRNTDQSIISISHACGDTSLRTFNRNFFRYVGCTPRAFRNEKGSQPFLPHANPTAEEILPAPLRH